MPSTQESATGHNPGPGSNIYIAFAPWILFGALTQRSELRVAAAAALAAAVAISFVSLRASRPKVLEFGAIVAFTGLALAGLLVDSATADWLTRYARAIAAGLLALIAFGSLLWIPFTEQYARESVPRRLWASPRFKQINRRLTVMWGLVFTAMVPSHILAGAIDTHRANTIFNWVVPVVLVVWAVKRTAAISGATQDDESDGRRQASATSLAPELP
jgi:hypothetical protein